MNATDRTTYMALRGLVRQNLASDSQVLRFAALEERMCQEARTADLDNLGANLADRVVARKREAR